jgi:endonuclease I
MPSTRSPATREAKLTSEDSDSWEPPADVRGEIARAAFYMDLRYSGDKADENDLQLTNDLSAISSDSVFFGKLDNAYRVAHSRPSRCHRAHQKRFGVLRLPEE